jgi:anaerobic selenocysteine-containing dehydrogenase
MFPRPAVDPIALGLSRYGGFGRWHSRVRQLPEFDGELPAAVMAEEMLTPGAGQIRAMLTSAGNPVLSSPNGRRLDEGLAGLEFMVAIDIYLNETTRHAHIILPPTAGLEHENYDLALHLLAIRNTARFSPALFAPGPDTRHDWEIFTELTTRLLRNGPVSGFFAKVRRAVLRWLGPEGLLDLGLRFGPYGAGWKVWNKGLTLRDLNRAPHGIDFGPLTPRLPAVLRTASKRIELAPGPFVGDLPRLQARFFPTANTTPTSGPELVLIGRRDLRSNNSWMHNCERLVRGKHRCTLLMHPRDAARIGIGGGVRVRLTSGVGSVVVEVALSDEVMPGVVSLPHGWGHTREGSQLRTAAQQPGASANDVTDHLAVDALSGNAAFSGIPVAVSRIGDSEERDG